MYIDSNMSDKLHFMFLSILYMRPEALCFELSARLCVRSHVCACVRWCLAGGILWLACCRLIVHCQLWSCVLTRLYLIVLRGVEGSCAKHLTIEFCTVVMLLTFILIIISIPSPLTLSFQAWNLPFLQILLTVAFLFLQDWLPGSSDCLPILLSIPIFLLLVFFCFFTL